jgi:hypothetical protein
MSRTAWRGIRLGLDGSTWTFLKLSLGWSVLTVLTLGMAYPWMAVELWRYQITHTRIGETVAEFKGSGRPLLFTWLPALIPLWLIAASLMVLGYESGFDVMKAIIYLGSPDDYEFLNIRTATIALAITLAIWLLLQFCFGLKLILHVIQNIGINASEFLSALSVFRLLIFGFLAILGAIFLSLIATLVLSFFITSYAVLTFPASGEVELFFGFSKSQLANIVEWSVLAGTISLFLTLPFSWALVYQFELIKQVFITTSVTNPEVLEGVVQSASDSQKTGEGLADAFDIGGL